MERDFVDLILNSPSYRKFKKDSENTLKSFNTNEVSLYSNIEAMKLFITIGDHYIKGHGNICLIQMNIFEVNNSNDNAFVNHNDTFLVDYIHPVESFVDHLVTLCLPSMFKTLFLKYKSKINTLSKELNHE